MPGGAHARRPALAHLRERVGLVTQDVHLFNASVRDNLTFFDRSISDAQIIATLNELELGEWLRSLSQGLDTELDTGNRSLSAGEAQLLAFTRVFLRDPGLVILDEASSRLDPATEQRLERAIVERREQETPRYLALHFAFAALATLLLTRYMSLTSVVACATALPTTAFHWSAGVGSAAPAGKRAATAASTGRI